MCKNFEITEIIDIINIDISEILLNYVFETAEIK